jgi:hypothetical protein
MNDCQRLDAIADELAVGLLTGVDRAWALEHLEDCHACRTEVATLTEVADAVLLLAPGRSPDAGFEQRIVTRVSQAAGGSSVDGGARAVRVISRRPHRLRRALAAAAVVAAIVTGSLVLAGRDAPPAVAATMIDNQGHHVGSVTLVADHRTQVLMDLPGWSSLVSQYGNQGTGDYSLVISLDDGSATRTPLRREGAGSWSVPTPIDRGHITDVAIVDQTGRTWCDATFADR